MKYVLIRLLKASIPIDVAKCVLPTPEEPIKSILSLFSIKRKLHKSNICALLILGSKLKSKSLMVLW